MFGCVGLRNKKYCILNKQYTKEQYEILVPQIIDSMIQAWTRWEFFSSAQSPFGYNETIANDYFPLTEEETITKWYNWESKSYDPNISSVSLIDMSDLPDISHVKDNILKQIFICKISSRPYRLVKEELNFYRKHWLSLPIYHPDIRHKNRIEIRDTYNFTLQ